MATDGGNHKGHNGGCQYVKDSEDRMTWSSRSLEEMTSEQEDRQNIEVRTRKKRKLDANNVITKRLCYDMYKGWSKLECCAPSSRQPMGHTFHLQTPGLYCAVVEGQGAAVVNILVQKGQVLWENQVIHIQSDTWSEILLSGILPRNVARSPPMVATSPEVVSLHANLEFSDLPVRVSNTTYGARDTRTVGNCGSMYKIGCSEITPAEGNKVLNSTSAVCSSQIMQQDKAKSADSACFKQLQTKLTEKSYRDKGEHILVDYNPSASDQKHPRRVQIIKVGKWFCLCSLLDNGQLSTFSKTLNSTQNGQSLKLFSGYRNACGQTGSTSHEDGLIVAWEQTDNTFEVNNKWNIQHENINSCQAMNNKNKRMRRTILGFRNDDNNNKNNNSIDHHLDTDDSSDSEIDCSYDETSDSCKTTGQSPEIPNAAPSAEYQQDAGNPLGSCVDDVNENFKQISMDSSGNSTQSQLKQATDTLMGIAGASLAVANDRGNCKLPLHKIRSELDVLQAIEGPGEKLVDVNCESRQEMCKCNPSEEYLYSRQACVRSRTDLDTQNNPEVEICFRSEGDDSKDAAMRPVDSSANQGQQMNEENTGNIGRDGQGGCGNSAARTNLCPSQDSDDSFKMAPENIENLSPSQEDFTENNGTLQTTCPDKAVNLDGKTNIELAETAKILRGFYDESETLKLWEGSGHVRQTGQCSLEDIKCVNFLGILTNRLTEHINKDAASLNHKYRVTSVDTSEQSQSDHVLSDTAFTSSTADSSDKNFISFCDITTPETAPTSAPLVKHEQRRRRENTPTTEISAEVKELERHTTGVGLENKIMLSSRQTRASNGPKKKVLAASAKDAKSCCPDVDLKTPSKSQLAEDGDLCEKWSNKYTMSLSDRFLQKYDLLTLQSKQKYKKSSESPKAGKATAMRNTNYEFADPAFEVDVFRSMEYATSLSCGLTSDKRFFGPVVCEQSNMDEHFREVSPTRGEDNCRKSYELEYDKETVSIKPPECQKTFSVSMTNSNETESDSYNRDRMIRASERRKKLMTEFEEITSCVDLYNWPNYDSKRFSYESGNFYHDLDGSLKGQVNNLDSTVQTEGKHIIGTLTVEYVNPPVSGFVFLK